jgi:hypothetical protein
MHMNLNEILSTLGVADALENLSLNWDQSVSNMPATAPRFLIPDHITLARQQAHLPATADPQLYAAARQISASPALLRLAWHCHCLLYQHYDYGVTQIRQWPLLTQALGEQAGAFYLLIALDAMPHVHAVHQTLGIPASVTHDTCAHIPEPVRVYQDQNGGRFGYYPRSLYWLRNHTKGDLYRLGRFEFMVKPFRGALHAFRHRQTRALLALAADATGFDTQGFIASADTTPAWHASLKERDGQITGFPIAPQGHAIKNQLTLSLEEWKPALCPDDPILEVHIPAGGNMTPEHCQAAMRQALDFFPRYFPQHPFVGFACSSWILNPQLDHIYRPDSNMVLWQRELYLFSTPSGDRSGVYFVFGEDDLNLSTAPRNTSLRRALLDHMDSGGRLIGGGMFILLEDFEHFGTQVYRQSFSASG